ncbi:MAG: nitroreductase family protein [Bacillota bacterium]
MNLMDVFHRRRAVRSFVQEQIPAEVWQDVLEAGRVAATSRGRQARRFVTVTDPARVRELAERAKMQEFVRDASALVIGCTPGPSNVDVIISLTQMETMAVAHGLGTIWLGTFDKEIIAQEINLPRELQPVLVMAFGYPAGDGVQREKLPLGELFFENSF